MVILQHVFLKNPQCVVALQYTKHQANKSNNNNNNNNINNKYEPVAKLETRFICSRNSLIRDTTNIIFCHLSSCTSLIQFISPKLHLYTAQSRSLSSLIGTSRPSAAFCHGATCQHFDQVVFLNIRTRVTFRISHL